MKATHLTNLLALGLLFSSVVLLRAETVFEASFDETPPYQPAKRLPGGFGKISYGKWYSDQQEAFPILVTEEKSLSEPLSLMLENTGVSLEPGKNSGVWGTWGYDNLNAAAITKPLSLTGAFLSSRVDGNENQVASLSIRGSGGSALLSVRIGTNGAVVIGNQQTTVSVAAIAAEKWYFLEIVMPDAEHPKTRPTVNLYEAKGKERGNKIGSAEGDELKPETTYTGFLLFNNLPNSKIFFDDFRVTVQD